MERKCDMVTGEDSRHESEGWISGRSDHQLRESKGEGHSCPSDAQNRERGGHFWIEGIRIVHEALAMEATVELLIQAPGLLTSEHAQVLVAQVPPNRRLAVSPCVFQSISDREGPRGLGAVVRMMDLPLKAIPLSEELLLVVAHQVRDPGNLGAIIRTADCVAASGVVVIEPAADPYALKAVRASMGSLFALPLVRLPDGTSFWRWTWEARVAGWPLQVVATSAHGTEDYRALDYRRPTVMLMGSEGPGLPDSAKAQADALVRIPLRGRASSLNVAAATAVLLYEVLNQRLIARQC
ncbi:MAG: RNA methyltransferase [Chloroflexota bacterium]|nr:RNA methyltransferase [Chloroflexota bacterium]